MDIELQLRELRQAPVQLQSAPKRSKTVDSRVGDLSSHTYGKCGRSHTGACRSGGACRKCGKEGHYARDCRQSAPVQDLRICYHFHQVGHLRASCPHLVARPVRVSAPATLRIIGGGQRGVELPRARGQAFQLVAEEVRSEPDTTTGMFLSCHLVICWSMYIC